jgi:hypothetical protein
LQGTSAHIPLLDAEDADEAEVVEDVDAPPTPLEDEPAPPAPPAPPLPEEELDDDDELGPVQSPPPSPPSPEPICELPVAHAAAAKIPNDVTAISTSHRVFIVLPRARDDESPERPSTKTLRVHAVKFNFSRAFQSSDFVNTMRCRLRPA